MSCPTCPIPQTFPGIFLSPWRGGPLLPQPLTPWKRAGNGQAGGSGNPAIVRSGYWPRGASRLALQKGRGHGGRGETEDGKARDRRASGSGGLSVTWAAWLVEANCIRVTHGDRTFAVHRSHCWACGASTVHAFSLVRASPAPREVTAITPVLQMRKRAQKG